MPVSAMMQRRAASVRAVAASTPRMARVRLVVRAQETQTQTTTTTANTASTSSSDSESRTASGGQLEFSANRERMEGYTERDTAGQSNMFPVVQRPYEAGSQADTGAGQEGGSLLIGGAAVVAAGLIAVGLVSAVGSSSPSVTAVEPEGSYQALSAYRATFASELGLNTPVAAAPAPAAAVEVVAAAPVEAVAATPAAAEAAL